MAFIYMQAPVTTTTESLPIGPILRIIVRVKINMMCLNIFSGSTLLTNFPMYFYGFWNPTSMTISTFPARTILTGKTSYVSMFERIIHTFFRAKFLCFKITWARRKNLSAFFANYGYVWFGAFFVYLAKHVYSAFSRTIFSSVFIPEASDKLLSTKLTSNVYQVFPSFFGSICKNTFSGTKNLLFSRDDFFTELTGIVFHKKNLLANNTMEKQKNKGEIYLKGC